MQKTDRLKALTVALLLVASIFLMAAQVNAVVYNVALKSGDTYTFLTTFYSNSSDPAQIAAYAAQNNTLSHTTVNTVMGVMYNGTTYYPAVNLTEALAADATYGYGSDYALIPANLTTSLIPDGEDARTYVDVTINTAFGLRNALHSTFVAQDNSTHDCYWDHYTGLLLTQNQTLTLPSNNVLCENTTLVDSSILTPLQVTPSPTPIIPEFSATSVVVIAVFTVTLAVACIKKKSITLD